MKKIVFSIIVFACFIALMASIMLPVSAISTDTEPVEYDSTEAEQLDVTDSYYYDRLSENQQECYAYIKNYYDNWQGEIGEKQLDILYWVGEDATDEECMQLNYDFIYAQLALEADYPLYDCFGDFGVSYHRHTEGNMAGKLEVTLHIRSNGFVTDEIKAQADARIEQIVTAVGEGDRYTRLRRMTAYLLDNTFYDPYIDALNYIETVNVQKTGIVPSTCAYGPLLKNIALCGGFSNAAKVLCNELGIPCIIMGNAKHAWNLVQMDDGKWYRLDITNAGRLGWDGDLPATLDDYFADTFLNNNTLLNIVGTYNDPYMLSLNNVPLVTDFPEHAEGQYVYSGDETDFSYENVQSTYMPEESKFIYRVNLDGTTCTIIDYEGKESGDLIIPESIDGYTVIAIGECAFYYCTGFTGRIVIPDTVQTIKGGAFAGCYNLTSVELPDGLYDIKIGAFIGCKGLKELVLPDLLGRISKYAFFDCDSLELVTFGSHVFEIDATAFGNIDAALTMKAPDGSAAHEYAQQNNLAFEVYGEMCAFEDADGKWDFDEMKDEYWRLVAEVVHFHTCEHGARFDYTEHSLDVENANCGDVCADCGANFCRGLGYTHTAPQRINKTEATCSDAAYTGDLVCVFGHLIQYGEYVGEPTGEHVPVDDVWRYDADTHYQLCSCGWRLEYSSHSGGEATTTQRAICGVCGVEYGELAEEHVHSAAWQGHDECSHYWVCSCGEQLDVEEHYGGTATETQLAICEGCGMTYGNLAEHVHSGVWQGYDEHRHYWICSCGGQLDTEAHYGGTATEEQRAICVGCGVEYGELVHVHRSFEWFEGVGGHYKVCVDCYESMGEIEPHYGGTSTEYEPATCEGCGCFYGELLPHATHVCSYWIYASEDVHYQICDICYVQFNEGPHQGGVATETQRAICELCDGAYGDLLPHATHVSFHWIYAGGTHYQICDICHIQFNEGPHQGGVATETQRAICELCDGAYGDVIHHVHSSVATDSDEQYHYKVCSCGEAFDIQAHYGGTATETQRAVCEGCGVEYGVHVHISILMDADEYGHFQICSCGETFDYEEHHGGTATEYELALCEVCGVAYGDLAAHVHNGGNGFACDEFYHYELCLCGAVVTTEEHYGGTATEYELALCEVCGTPYGVFASDTDHVHNDLTTVATEGFHYQVCSCGVWLGEERHYGGAATDTQRAICEVCGVEYGDYASDPSENNTEAPENNTEAPENNTEAPENNTEALENNTETSENNTKEPDSTNSATNAIVGGCGSSVGMGLISLVTALATGYVVLKKKKDN